jgi:hypothetical protein
VTPIHRGAGGNLAAQRLACPSPNAVKLSREQLDDVLDFLDRVRAKLEDLRSVAT